MKKTAMYPMLCSRCGDEISISDLPFLENSRLCALCNSIHFEFTDFGAKTDQKLKQFLKPVPPFHSQSKEATG